MPKAFTLIELLVVITIIVVLLSLLAPAMDKAIYQAELVVCGTRHKTLASGFTTYAIAYKRQYPRTNPARGTQRMLKQGATDMRPLLRDFVSINGVFNDPLLTQVDHETAENPNTWSWTCNFWYAGFGFNNYRGMYKVGDRFGFTRPTASGSLNHSFNVMSGDANFRWDEGANGLATSHPDHNGVLFESAVQEGRPDGEGDAAVLAADAGALDPVTLSEWLGEIIETTLDLNFAFQDGSVGRYNDVVIGKPNVNIDDERMIPVPWGAGGEGGYPIMRTMIPER